MQVKSEVFSRFGSSVDFSSGEPLGGVEASTVGADLCVRPSSPERSLFCGRTRRSAPTQATSARQFHSSNAVTPISVGADLCVRLSSPERSLFCGRTRRSAPTQTTSTRKVQPSDSVTPVFVETHEPCVPTKDYTSLFDTTDALLLSERSYTFCATATWKNPNLHVAIFHSPRGDLRFPT